MTASSIPQDSLDKWDDANWSTTDKLVVEVLVSRRRLGELSWPFERDRSVTTALNRLRDRHVVQYSIGRTAGTWDVQLSYDYWAKVEQGEYMPQAYRTRAWEYAVEVTGNGRQVRTVPVESLVEAQIEAAYDPEHRSAVKRMAATEWKSIYV